jgi:hypothetical protein
MKANNNDLSCKNTENPDVASQRAGPDVYIDLFSTKPNEYRLSSECLNFTQQKKWSNNNYLTLARSGTKAARALHLLVSDPQKAAPKQQTSSV